MAVGWGIEWLLASTAVRRVFICRSENASCTIERFKYLNVINILNIIYKVIKMVSVTLSVPEDIKQEMDQFPEINWSAVAREAIQQRLVMLHKFREFTKDSTLTEEEALQLGREVSRKAQKRHKK